MAKPCIRVILSMSMVVIAATLACVDLVGPGLEANCEFLSHNDKWDQYNLAVHYNDFIDCPSDHSSGDDVSSAA